MHVLVTGATGFIGSWVVRELLARGHSVRVLVRPSSSQENLEGLAVERAPGDVLDRASVERALAGCEGVVHGAGVVGFDPGRVGAMHAVNHRSVEIVLGAALDAGVRRAVLTSSVAALGGWLEPRVADERTPCDAERSGVHYLVSKLHGEQAGLALAARGLPLVVTRPGVVLGPGDVHRSSTATVLGLARRRLRFYVRGGASFCDVRDVAAAHAEALARGRAGEVYILGGHNLEIGDFVERVAAVAGVAPARRVPYPVALAAAAAGEVAGRLLGRKPRLPSQLIRASRLYTFVSSAKAETELGYRVRPIEESLRDTFRWSIAHGRLRADTPQLRALAGEGGTPRGALPGGGQAT